MIVFNSNDQSEIVHIFEVSHLKNNLSVDFTQKAILNPSNYVAVMIVPQSGAPHLAELGLTAGKSQADEILVNHIFKKCDSLKFHLPDSCLP